MTVPESANFILVFWDHTIVAQKISTQKGLGVSSVIGSGLTVTRTHGSARQLYTKCLVQPHEKCLGGPAVGGGGLPETHCGTVAQAKASSHFKSNLTLS